MRICPFCNFNEGSVHETSYKEPKIYKVVCNVCGSSGPEAKTREMAEQKWDGLLLDIELDEVKELLDEDMGGVSAPMATLANAPGVGNATPASTAATTSAQQTSSSTKGSGDNWGAGSMYDQKGKIKKKKGKKKGKKKISESNINPYDKIGVMMAKKMDIELPFKKLDSRTNTVKQKEIDENGQIPSQFKIPTLDSYEKASKLVPDHPLTSKKKKVNEESEDEVLRHVKAKEELKLIGIPFTYKNNRYGYKRVFIKGNLDSAYQKLLDDGWERSEDTDYTRNFVKDDQEISIYSSGYDLPEATLRPIESEEEIEESFVSSKLEDYIGEGKCPKSGCTKKVGNKWRVISNKTGKLWPAKYDTEEDAKKALGAYHIHN